jgi:NAD(P)-dependent dehydrogenase (short-subunit alcohol dehydrogenase family)
MLPLPRASSAARIINLPSVLGSLTINGDPNSPFYAARLTGHYTSKAAVYMLTLQLNAKLRGNGITSMSVSHD